jgi:hypothetical protein
MGYACSYLLLYVVSGSRYVLRGKLIQGVEGFLSDTGYSIPCFSCQPGSRTALFILKLCGPGPTVRNPAANASIPDVVVRFELGVRD